MTTTNIYYPQHGPSLPPLVSSPHSYGKLSLITHLILSPHLCSLHITFWGSPSTTVLTPVSCVSSNKPEVLKKLVNNQIKEKSMYMVNYALMTDEAKVREYFGDCGGGVEGVVREVGGGEVVGRFRVELMKNYDMKWVEVVDKDGGCVGEVLVSCNVMFYEGVGDEGVVEVGENVVEEIDDGGEERRVGKEESNKRKDKMLRRKEEEEKKKVIKKKEKMMRRKEEEEEKKVIKRKKKMIKKRRIVKKKMKRKKKVIITKKNEDLNLLPLIKQITPQKRIVIKKKTTSKRDDGPKTPTKNIIRKENKKRYMSKVITTPKPRKSPPSSATNSIKKKRKKKINDNDIFLDKIIKNAKNLFEEMTRFETENNQGVGNQESVFSRMILNSKEGKKKINKQNNSSVISINELEEDIDDPFDDLDDMEWVDKKLKKIIIPYYQNNPNQNIQIKENNEGIVDNDDASEKISILLSIKNAKDDNDLIKICKIPISNPKEFVIREREKIVIIPYNKRKRLKRTYSCVIEVKSKNKKKDLFGLNSIPLEPIMDGFNKKNKFIGAPIIAYDDLLGLKNPFHIDDQDLVVLKVILAMGKHNDILALKEKIEEDDQNNIIEVVENVVSEINEKDETVKEDDIIVPFVEKGVIKPKKVKKSDKPDTIKEKQNNDIFEDMMPFVEKNVVKKKKSNIEKKDKPKKKKDVVIPIVKNKKEKPKVIDIVKEEEIEDEEDEDEKPVEKYPKEFNKEMEELMPFIEKTVIKNQPKTIVKSSVKSESNIDQLRSSLTIQIIRAVGLQEAINQYNKSNPDNSCNLASKVGINSFVRFDLLTLENQETDILVRSFCPEFKYFQEIDFHLDEKSYSYFENGFCTFQLYHRVPKKKGNPKSVIFLGKTKLKLSSLLVSKNGIFKRWISLYNDHGNIVGAIQVSLNFDSNTLRILKIDETSQEEQEHQVNELCKISVMIDHITIPKHILFNIIPNNSEDIYPVNYYVTYNLDDQIVETRYFSTSNQCFEITLNHSSSINKSISAEFFNYLKNEIIEFKLFLSLNSESKSEDDYYLGSAFVSLSNLLFKKLEHSNENIVWIGGNFLLINEKADNLSNGNMKIKVICETQISREVVNKDGDMNNSIFYRKGRRRAEIRYTPRNSMKITHPNNDTISSLLLDEDVINKENENDLKSYFKNTKPPSTIPEKEVTKELNFDDDSDSNVDNEDGRENSFINFNNGVQEDYPTSTPSMLLIPVNYLNIDVKSALNLSPNIYYSVSIQNGENNKYITETPFINSSKTNKWDYKYKLPVYSKEFKTLNVLLWSKYDKNDKKEMIGKYVLDLFTLRYGINIDGLFPIDNQILIKMEIYPDNLNEMNDNAMNHDIANTTLPELKIKLNQTLDELKIDLNKSYSKIISTDV